MGVVQGTQGRRRTASRSLESPRHRQRHRTANPRSSARPSPWASMIPTLYPGFPFCLPWMAPLYTRRAPSARNFVHRSIVQLQRPSPQPALTGDRLEPPGFRHFLDTAPQLGPFFSGFPRSAVAGYPPGTGSAQILRSMSPNSRRVRCPSASRSQQEPAGASRSQQEPVVPGVLH